MSWSLHELHSIDDSVQDCSISSALAMEILQSCTEPSIFHSRLFRKWDICDWDRDVTVMGWWFGYLEKLFYGSHLSDSTMVTNLARVNFACGFIDLNLMLSPHSLSWPVSLNCNNWLLATGTRYENVAVINSLNTLRHCYDFKSLLWFSEWCRMHFSEDFTVLNIKEP